MTTTTTEPRTYARSFVTLIYRLPKGGGTVHRATTREGVGAMVLHLRRYAHASDFRVEETTSVETITTADITAEVLS